MRLEDDSSKSEKTSTADFIKSNALLSLYDSYRACLRLIIHHIVDFENSMIETEAELNKQA